MPPRSSQDIYARGLSTPYGYPLWTPELEERYLCHRQPDGLRIGDVGRVDPEHGCFEILFSICSSPNDSLHQEFGVPEYFIPLEISETRDIRSLRGIDPPTCRSSLKTVAVVDLPAGQRDIALGYEFTLKPPEGAILVLPEGTKCEDLRNRDRFRDHAVQYGALWCRYAKQTRGWHEPLYLITGFHKAKSWSLAAHELEDGTESHVGFRAKQIGGANIVIGNAYSWGTPPPPVRHRIGPRDAYGNTNQTVFIRGFRITPNTAYKEPLALSLAAGIFGEANVTGLLGTCFPGMIHGGGVKLKLVPEVDAPFHPCDEISKYLLQQELSANIAITHDDDWITLLEKGVLTPDELVREERLSGAVCQVYRVTSQNGAAFLERKDSNSPRPALVNLQVHGQGTSRHPLNAIPYDASRPTRPDFGKLGKLGVLQANFFLVRFPKNGVIYNYHVEFSPKTDIRSIKGRLFQLLEQSNHPDWQQYVPFIAHDCSARLVSSKKLPQPLDVPVPLLKEGQKKSGKQDKTYTISINFTQELKCSDLQAFINDDPDKRGYDFAPIVGAYNLVLRHYASRNGVRVGKNRYFFPSDGQPQELSVGIQACRGFFMSARPVYKELMINVGVCMMAFYTPGNLADAIMEFQRRSKGAMLQRFAQRLKVTISHLGYKQTRVVKRITNKSAKATIFQCDELDGMVSVEQYFKRKYNITLKYADLPVVDISGPNAKHPIFVPPELCEIPPGLPFHGILDDQQATLMPRYACKPPAENAAAILNKGFPQLGLTADNQKLVNFGISVSSEMAGTPFRELPPPDISYGAGKANVRDGAWNILDVKFQCGGMVKSWWIMVVTEQRPVFNGPNDPRLQGLWKGFAAKCQKSGMSGITPTTPPVLLNVNLVNPTNDPGRQQSLARISSTIRRKRDSAGIPSFMLVILSTRDNFIYPGIKRICDVELGVHTTHMQSKVLADPGKQDQYFSNVALKVNTKLGGINHKLDDKNVEWLMKPKTMLVGMDVTHPGPGSVDGTPSIAAVVASIDRHFVQFPASMRCQTAKKEIVTDVREMMIERLQKFQEVSKILPDRVIVFRSGVSEGQIGTVLEMELPEILEAFKRVSPGRHYRPLLTIVIYGKRHHVRFFPHNALGDGSGNTRPGTVVDQGITAAFDFDFYLQAHAGLQGHAKPTHYTVIYDESRLSADEVQQGINTACYLYARATRSVSLVPPAYYANLACKRGRCYLNDFLVSEDKTTTTSKGESEVDKETERKKVYDAAISAWGSGVHPNLAGSMFYI